MDYAPDTMISSRFLRKGESAVVSPNERSVLRLLWNNPGTPRTTLNTHLDLTQQSIYRIVDNLVERGMVQIGAPVPGQGRGQPSPTLRLNGDYAYSCGISINADVIHLYLMDFAGKLTGHDSIPLLGQSMGDALREVGARLAGLRDRSALSEDTNLGIGVGMMGYNVGGTRFNGPLPLHEWSLIELGPLLTSEFDKPVWIHNSGQMASVAEAMFGAGRHVRHFAYLFIGYGFGGGLISDGELLLGGNGNAGEFACILEPGEINKRPALKYLIGKLASNGIEISSIDHLRQSFKADWPGVSEWLDDITPAYNRLINAIWGVFGPQAIVFGGQVPPALANMLIERTVSFELPRYGVPHPPAKLLVSELEGDATAMGAAAIPFKRLVF
ncbi:ROK family transcriptional regulator [Roseibium sp. Sym1]|uniref:ROK family transcriptional regulator n=1 Tax=Roseibium sp. Sym1 TaxID=3016006 RepID=UPI0022B43CC5|nr:ROK family transcriptional regulator [Roseibium sp. Sym1]